MPLRNKQRPRTGNNEDLAERLRGDRVFAFAQVTLLVKLMLTVLVLDAQSFDAFTLPKSVVAHATSLVLAALLLWLLARYGRSLIVWSPVHIAAGGLLLAFALATPFALDPVVALFGTFKRYLGLTQMLDNVLLYVAVGVLFRDARSLRLLAGVALGTAVPVLAYMFVQYRGLDPLTFQQAATLIPIGTIGNPDIAGAYTAIVAVTALGFSVLLWGRYRAILVAGCGAIGVAALAALFTTSIRAGVLAVALGWVGVLVIALLWPGRARARPLIVLGVGAAMAVGVILSPIGARLGLEALRADTASVGIRIEIWAAAERALAERPLLGLGPDNFVASYTSHRTENAVLKVSGELQNSTHDLWLYVATSSGLVGAVALLLLVGLLLERGVRLARRGEPGAFALVPLLAYLGQSLVGVNEIVLDWIFWVSAGVIAVAGAVPVARSWTSRSTPRRASLVGTVALTVAVVTIVLGVLPRLAAGEAMAWSEAYSAANRGRDAIPYAEATVSADSRRGESWSTYGTALAKAGGLAAAVTAYTVAAEREVWQSQNWRNLAITWAQLGNRIAALAAAERATRVNPYDGELHELVATVAYEQGDFAKAAAEGERAIELRVPPQVSTYFTTASAYVQLKDLERAEAIARQGVAREPDPILLLQLAAILADRGKTAEAISVVDRLLQDSPTNPDALRLKQLLSGP